jgi:membrane-associated phospholipid phosphatase
MLGVGALALENPGLRSVNRFVRKAVLETKPNLKHHFEDNLRHLPTASAFFMQAVGIEGKHNFIGKATVYALATTIANQSVDRLKSVSRVLRPDGSDRRSFPSGHTTTAFVAAEFLRQEYKDVSPWIGIAGYTTAAATGALRIYHNKHWLTDVVAGAGVGILSTNLAYFVYSRSPIPRSKRLQRYNFRVLPVYSQKSLGIGLHYKPD